MNKLNEDFHNILTALGVAHEAKDGDSATPAKAEPTPSDSEPATDEGDSTPASDGGDSSKAPDAGNFLSWLFQH